ncbi:MFS transporter [Streptococcus equi subsp. zooepidemicus]|uniref:MFS transporter n=1 Tax=Streptococcus equi TaxID=1336 RepID=UPI00030D5AF3|nr:MFS transporter [Streptococcus equi]AIA68101.1 quinolone MFS transporter [Streptococcus equi subsp. zooepidemicus CY]MBR7683977.1 MFS transporter [Streptococcus equi subsp. zooepidemicus]MBR7752889.1 MFS transporter [Streptococcus equi subsp. zooepidemicus]MBR7775809.1 MFS transporter [Streptococcus equi subsp. zooepidemicus]NMW54813.1 MFS transporter [Streptococcus equi subsp. zooepidemicus]
MEDKLFNKHFIGITVLNFIVYMVYYLFTVIIAFVATKELGAKTSEAGLATGIYILGTLLARLIFGKQLEVFGRRLVLRGGAIFYLLTTLAYFFMPTIGMMYLVRLLNGFGYGVVSTATNTIVTAYIPARKRGEGINFYGLSTSLAAAIGPFVGTFMLDNLHIDFRLIIVLCSVLIAVVVAGAFAFPVTDIILNSEQLAKTKSWTVDSFIERKALFITLIAFLMGIAYASVLGFQKLYTTEIHLTTVGAYFFVVYALIITITRPAMGRLMDVKGEQWVLYPSYLFLALGLFLLGSVTSSLPYLLSGALIGFGYGTFMSCGQAASIKGVEEHRFNTAMSTYMIGLDLGLGAGPYLLGLIKDMLLGSGVQSFRQLFWLAAVIPVACAVMYFLKTQAKAIDKG